MTAQLGDGTIAVLVAVGVVAVFLFGVLTSSRRTPRELPADRLSAVETRLGSVESRLGTVELRGERVEKLAERAEHDARNVRMAVGGLATKDSVSDVQKQLGELRGEVRAVVATTDAMHHSLDRVERFLIDAAAKRIVGLGENGREG